MWVTALLLGFAGSMHCMGMCSPLVMAVTSMQRRALLNRAIYNSGRILVYSIAGALVATIGMALPFENYQNIISVSLGIALLVIGFAGTKSLRIPGMMSHVQKVTLVLKRIFGRYLQQKTKLSMFIMGGLNGMLPCGLTLVALSTCLTLRGPMDGFNFMLLFGAGTLPVMLGFTAFLPLLTKKFNLSLSRLTTSMLILSGIVLIARVFLIHKPHIASGDTSFVELMLCN